MTTKSTIESKHAERGREVQPSPRRGFTLIELLMVVIIIGFLAAIVLVAVTRALATGRATRIVTEIDLLNTAVETYRTDRGAYPPTMGNFPGEASANKQVRITRHLSKAFPRYIGSNSGMTAYQNFQLDVATATQYPASLLSSPPNQATANGGGHGLNIDNLDPAETMVFWLAGLPDPTTENKVAGFRNDLANPFVDPTVSPSTLQNVSGAPSLQGSRTNPYKFDPGRLVDRDGDGWLEYLPAGMVDANGGPPLVYFDFAAYTGQTGPVYPAYQNSTWTSFTPSADQGNLISNQNQWGACVPYGSSITAAGFTWINSQKFQIISAGLDNAYTPPTETVIATFPFYQVDIYPSGQAYPIATGNGFEPQERDNLTNFAKGPLGDDLP